jgi:hypothetical protein
MKCVHIKENNIAGTRLDLIPMGDWHLGSKECRMDKIKSMLDWIKNNPNARVILMGDIMNLGTRDSVGGGVFDDDFEPQEQYELALDLLTPIKNKIYGYLVGNHEENRIRAKTSIDLSKNLCRELKIQFCGFSTFFKIKFGKQNYIIYATHGSSGALLPHTKIKAAINLSNYFEAEIYCFDKETEILTPTGFKKYHEINEGDKILAYDINDSTIKETNINEKIQYTHNGEMIRFKVKGAEILVTPNHRMLRKCIKSHTFHTAEDFSKFKQSNIPAAGYTLADGIDLTNDEIRLAAWLISEGHFRKGKTSGYDISLSQSTISPFVDEIKNILNRLNIIYSEYIQEAKDFYDKRRNKTYKSHPSLSWYIHSEYANKIKENIVSEKNIPDYFFNMNHSQFRIFLHEMFKGDGCCTGEQSGYYYSNDESLIDKLQHLCTIHGIRTVKRHRSNSFELSCSNFDELTLVPYRTTTKVPYNDIVWCVNNDLSTVIARRNGRVFITGNCHGHLHELATHTGLYYKIDMRHARAIEHKKYYVLTGSFLDYENSYAQAKNYGPVKIGCPKIKLYKDKHDIHISV